MDKEQLQKEIQSLVFQMGEIEVKRLELDTLKIKTVEKMNEVFEKMGQANDKVD